MPRIRQYADKYALADLASHISGRAKMSGKTQQDIGDVLGVSQQAVSHLLRKPENITVSALRKLAKEIELDPAVILKAVGIKEEKQ